MKNRKTAFVRLRKDKTRIIDVDGHADDFVGKEYHASIGDDGSMRVWASSPVFVHTHVYGRPSQATEPQYNERSTVTHPERWINVEPSLFEAPRYL